MTEVETQLAELVAALRALPRVESSPPRFTRRPGESVEDWLVQLMSARSEADERAVRHRHRVDELSKSLFGASVVDLLPKTDRALVRSEIRMPVASDARLTNLVPALEGVVPHGSGRRTAELGEVRVSVTAPAGADNAIVRVHGGAFWMGGGDVSERSDALVIDHFAAAANAVVFDVDHRLAPEHPFPAAIIDVLCVIDAIRDGSAGVPAGSPIALLGISSGANIATLAARADGLRSPARPLAALALIVPSVLLSEVPPALRDHPESWAMRMNQLRAYLGPDIDPDNSWVSPAVETLLTGMPPTFAAIAEYDEVAAGGARLCDAISAGGSLAEARSYPMTHTVATPTVEAAVTRDVIAFLRARFAAATTASPPETASPQR